MLADLPDIDAPTSKGRSHGSPAKDGFLDAGLPVARMGLEHEFFLLDRMGEPCDLADPFWRECRRAARTEGLDPRCFEAESVKGMVEITTPPCYGVGEMTRHYLDNLGLALGVASEMGLALYPLGTYPLPTNPVLRDDPGYALKARTLGYGRFSHAGRCAGAHLHLELPAGTVWPYVKAALDAPLAAQRELLAVYNLATALDPALVALTRACPFYEGKAEGIAARTVHYRGILDFDGVYAGLSEVGGLSAYASRVEDLIDQQRARYRAWFKAMDLAGLERRLFAQTGGNLHRASWNPVRLSHHGTVEFRSMDANFPEMVLAVCALIRGAAERVRRERLEVRPSRGVLTLEPDGALLRVPVFSYLNGELLGAAATGGVQDRRVEAYVDSFVKFASPYVERPELVGLLGSSGGYKNTEAEILGSLPTQQSSVTREQGLRLVRAVCSRLNEQVSFLRRRHDEVRPKGERDPEVARVIDIRDSSTAAAEKARPESANGAHPTSRAANEGVV